jgi:hypothetical protein
MRGTEANLPRTLTKRSDVLPLPGGEGGVRGKALFDSPSHPQSFKSRHTLPIQPRIAKNLLFREINGFSEFSSNHPGRRVQAPKNGKSCFNSSLSGLRPYSQISNASADLIFSARSFP